MLDGAAITDSHLRRADPYCRLRVPKYQKVFEALFFISFLALYYAVSAERNPRHIIPTEVLLYIWIAGFAYDEFGEFKDAGTLFYAADFWSLWDLGIIGVGAAYLITRESAKTLFSWPYDWVDSQLRGDSSLRNGQSADMRHTGVIGLVNNSDHFVEISFDILSLEALFLVPRYVGLT